MSRVFQCDRCKAIFEPRVLQSGEPYITRKAYSDVDLCPTCHQMMKDWLNNKAENKCATCRFKAYKITDKPCKACCYSHDSCYEKEANNE